MKRYTTAQLVFAILGIGMIVWAMADAMIRLIGGE